MLHPREDCHGGFRMVSGATMSESYLTWITLPALPLSCARPSAANAGTEYNEGDTEVFHSTQGWILRRASRTAPPAYLLEIAATRRTLIENPYHPYSFKLPPARAVERFGLNDRTSRGADVLYPIDGPLPSGPRQKKTPCTTVRRSTHGPPA